MSERAEGVEPFPTTADPRNYVQTPATEDALEGLQQKVREGRAPVVLVGAPGVGKTLLLRVLERRLGSSFRVAYLPFAALPADELCTWVLGLLGEIAGRDPERELLAASLRVEETGSALVVMLDDAGSMPVATARRLSAILAEAEGAIRLVLALAEDLGSAQMLSSFQPPASRIELRALMSADETARYLRAHLVRSNASLEVCARFDPPSIRYLHLGSGGVPRVLSGLAGELARGNLAVLPRHETAVPDGPVRSVSDPFDVTTDPAAYVPRRATQELLGSVESALGRGARAIAVTGPPGLGKTMLLRVLERRLRGSFQAVRISYTALLPDELCRWILTLLGEPVAEDPEAALFELASRLGDARKSLVLLLDDAGSIPTPTVRHLVELASATDGAMRLVLFALDDVRTAGIVGALGPDAVALRFREPMSEDETAQYIYARLSHARAQSSLVERFDPETVAELYVESEGIPRELHKLASELYREGGGAIAPRTPALDVPDAPVSPEPQARRTPPVPPVEGAEETQREPVAARAAISRRQVFFGLVVIAILLAAIPLLRGGFSWMPAIRRADPVVAPPDAAQSSETPARPAVHGSAEPIAVSINAMPSARVEVDGEYLGVTPLADILLSPGLHVFRATMPDGEIREHRVEVGATMRHVVFYADPTPKEEEVAPEPELVAEPAPPPAVPGEAPEIVKDAIPPLERTLPETPVVPEPVAVVESPQPSQEQMPEMAAESVPSPPVPEEPPESAVTPEQVSSDREPAVPAPTPEPISVSINVMPWAAIEIDDVQVGITPLAGVLLTPGDHLFRVQMPDGTIFERTVQIGPDNRHIAFTE